METARRLTEKIKDDMDDQNVDKFLEFLREVPTHDEFLKHIGCSIDETPDTTDENPDS